MPECIVRLTQIISSSCYYFPSPSSKLAICKAVFFYCLFNTQLFHFSFPLHFPFAAFLKKCRFDIVTILSISPRDDSRKPVTACRSHLRIFGLYKHPLFGPFTLYIFHFWLLKPILKCKDKKLLWAKNNSFNFSYRCSHLIIPATYSQLISGLRKNIKFQIKVLVW